MHFKNMDEVMKQWIKLAPRLQRSSRIWPTGQVWQLQRGNRLTDFSVLIVLIGLNKEQK